MRSVVKRMGTVLNPKTLVYQLLKFKVRAMRVIEAVETLVGARAGEKLVVNFRANTWRIWFTARDGVSCSV